MTYTYEKMKTMVETIQAIYNRMEERDQRDSYGHALMRDWHTLTNIMSDIREGYLSHSHFDDKQYQPYLVSGIDKDVNTTGMERIIDISANCVTAKPQIREVLCSDGEWESQTREVLCNGEWEITHLRFWIAETQEWSAWMDY